MSANTVNQTTGALSKIAGLYNSQKIDTMYNAYPEGASASNKLVSDATADEKISDESQVIFEVMGEMGAKNLLPLTLDRLKRFNNSSSDTWSDNILTKNTGVTFKINTDDVGIVTSIVVNASNPSGASFLNFTNSNNKVHLKAGDYKLNGGVSGGGENSYCWYITYPTSVYKWVTDNDLSVSLSTDTDVESSIVIRAGQTLVDATFKPMIRLASIKNSDFVPYAMTNRELTKLWLEKTFLTV